MTKYLCVFFFADGSWSQTVAAETPKDAAFIASRSVDYLKATGVDIWADGNMMLHLRGRGWARALLRIAPVAEISKPVDERFARPVYV